MSIPPRVWVENLGSAVRHSAIDEIPDLVIRVVDEDIWREFDSKMGVKTNATFEEFVTSEPLKGIGTSVETLRKLCTGNTTAINALDKALQRPAGGDQRSEESKTTVLNHDSDVVDRRKNGLLRSLRKNHPEEHESVLSGIKSVTAAAIDAGIYPRRCSVNLSDAESAAATLRAKTSPEYLAQLKELL